MDIMGNRCGNDQLQSAVAKIVEGIEKIVDGASKKIIDGASSSDDSEEVEVNDDILTYRKTRTVTEIDVSLSALAASGVTLIQALAAAFRGPKNPDPIDQLSRLMRQMPDRDNVFPTGTFDERMAKFQKAQDAAREAKFKSDSLKAVFGDAHVDCGMVALAASRLMAQLEHDLPDGKKVLDQDGLADAAAQVVAMIPETQWASLIAPARADVADLTSGPAKDLPTAVAHLAVAFVPEMHRDRVIASVLNAARDRENSKSATQAKSAPSPESPSST